MVGLESLELQYCYTMMFIFNFIQSSIGFLPMLLVFLQDAIISFRRVSAFLKLPEIDQSYLSRDYNNEKAIQITGGHSFSYGLEDDHEVKPELDPLHFMKVDRLHLFHRLKLIPEIRQRAGQSTNQELVALINEDKYDIKHPVCNQICRDLNVPATSYFMLIKNYNQSYFNINRDDDNEKALKKLYLHQCVIKNFIDEYDGKNAKNKVVPVIKNLNFTVEKGQLIGLKGAVGSGKTSFFNCILREMKIIDRPVADTSSTSLVFDYFGEQPEDNAPDESTVIRIGGKIAFCPQSSPIFSMTIRENICFFKPYEEERYNRIVDICCLTSTSSRLGT